MASSDGNDGGSRPQTVRTGPRTVGQIELDLEAARGRLSVSLEDLIGRVHPAVVSRRVRERINERVQQVKERARAQVVDEYGDLRTTRLALVGGAFAAAVTLALVVRSASRRHHRRQPSASA